MVASDTMNIAKRFTSIFAVLAVSASLGAAVPAASAGSAMADTTVTATRSFPKTTAAKRDFLAEHTSTDVESNADWGGIESLDVPQTESQAEKDRKAQEQAEAEAQAQAQAAQAQTQTQAEAQTASRSSERADISSVPTAPASATGQALADYALSVCVWRQYSVRLGLLWFRAVGVRPVRCKPAAFFWCPDERWNGCGKHCRSSSRGYHRQYSACRDLYWQRHGDQRAESGSGNAGYFAGRVLRWLCDSSCALSEHTV